MDNNPIASQKASAVLLVDDSQDELLLERRILEAEGIVVDLASTAEVAIQKIQSHQYDLVVMDLNLPGMDGYEAIAQIRLIPGRETAKVVARSAHAMRQHREAALSAGFDGWIQKPIDVEVFMRQISEFLKQN